MQRLQPELEDFITLPHFILKTAEATDGNEKEAAQKPIDANKRDYKMTERTVLSKILFHVVAVACVVGVGIGIGYAIGNNQTTTTTTSSSCNNTKNTPPCDVSQVNLSTFEVWKRGEGYWYGTPSSVQMVIPTSARTGITITPTTMDSFISS